MHKHPVVGEQILIKVPALADVISIVRQHHERVDGQGYPDGIHAQANLLAAIINVCDAYQAMTSDRPYRKAYSHVQAIDEIRRCSGTQFVPQVVEAFLAVVGSQDAGRLKVYRLEPALLTLRRRRSTSPESLQSNDLSQTSAAPTNKATREK